MQWDDVTPPILNPVNLTELDQMMRAHYQAMVDNYLNQVTELRELFPAAHAIDYSKPILEIQSYTQAYTIHPRQG